LAPKSGNGLMLLSPHAHIPGDRWQARAGRHARADGPQRDADAVRGLRTRQSSQAREQCVQSIGRKPRRAIDAAPVHDARHRAEQSTSNRLEYLEPQPFQDLHPQAMHFPCPSRLLRFKATACRCACSVLGPSPPKVDASLLGRRPHRSFSFKPRPCDGLRSQLIGQRLDIIPRTVNGWRDQRDAQDRNGGDVGPGPQAPVRLRCRPWCGRLTELNPARAAARRLPRPRPRPRPRPSH
jgi:hypothetical protein